MVRAEKLTVVRRVLEVMMEPLSRSLALAPLEEEIAPETAPWIELVHHWREEGISARRYPAQV